MKRKILVGLLCLSVLLVPSLANAAGISSSDISATNQANLKKVDESSNVDITVGKVHMLKSVSNGFVILTFSETGGFTSDTYNSILTALKVILNEKNYNHFVKNYPAISSQSEVKFTGFRVKRNPARLDDESHAFGDVDILRVEICSNEFGDIPNPTPTPTPTPKPSATPSTSTPVTNPSTGDMNVVVIGTVVTVAVLGAYFSVRKIREN